MGYFSLIITELNIMTFYQRNMLFGTEWSMIPHPSHHQALTFTHSCGVPLFANATSTKCKQCEKDITLSINPRIVRPLSSNLPSLPSSPPLHTPFPTPNPPQTIQTPHLLPHPKIGPLTDETGHIGTGKLIWSPQAWEQLLGRTAAEFVTASTEVLKYLECRMLFMRVTVMFGWSERVGKLCVCEVST